jgi:DNA invertase Pin-like site-specific DNA recombinase
MTMTLMATNPSKALEWKFIDAYFWVCPSLRSSALVSEVSRLARSTLQVLEIGRECIEKGVQLHVTKSNIVFDNILQSRIVAVVLGLVAEIERDFISSRTKEALTKRKADGYLDKGINKVAIAKLLDVSPYTLYEWLKVRRPTANLQIQDVDTISHQRH